MDRERQRRDMVERQIRGRDVGDERVLAAMLAVPRHRFVPRRWRAQAYDDSPLPLGIEQTISQPYIVAYICEQAMLQAGARVLEIGTGSGYQAAVLAEMGMDVYSIELDADLCETAIRNLAKTGYGDVKVRSGDGYAGWPEATPFQAILLTAAPMHVPPPLIDQLAEGGVLIAPLGGGSQSLERLVKSASGIEQVSLMPVRFVPMRGAGLRDDGC